MIDDQARTTTESAPANRDMPSEEFRRYGQGLIEWIANYLEDPRRYPVLAHCQPGELRRRLPATGPIEGESMDAILHDFEQVILPAVTHWNHPRFHAYFSVSSSAPGILGELLTAALDANAMLWKSLRQPLNWNRLPFAGYSIGSVCRPLGLA